MYLSGILFVDFLKHNYDYDSPIQLWFLTRGRISMQNALGIFCVLYDDAFQVLRS